MRLLTLTLLITVFSTFLIGVSGQDPELEWDKTIGGDYADQLGGIYPSLNGDGFYLFGSSSSNASGEKTAPPYSLFSNDIWIVKYNSSWEKQWDKVIGGTLNDDLSSVLRLSDGGFLIGSTSFSNASGDKSEDTKGVSDSDYWIIRIDDQANIIWEKTIGGADLDDLGSIFYHPDGGFLATGTTYSGKSGDKTHEGYGNQDIWVVRFDQDGKILWDKVYGGERFEQAGGIYPLDDGFILNGKSDSPPSGTKTAEKRGSYDAWMTKIDLDGNVVWDKAFGGSDNEGSSSVMKAHDGGYLLSITSKSDISGDKTSPDIGGNDAWFIKVDASFNIEWDKTLGTLDQDNLGALRITNGGYLLVGTHTVQEAQPGGGMIDYGKRWMKICDDQLVEEWDYKFGGDKDETGGPMWIMENDSSTALLGSGSTSNISGEKTENSRGGIDFWITRFKFPFGIYRDHKLEDYPLSVNQKNNSQFNLYPNPVNDGTINLVSDLQEITQVDMISLAGVKMKSFNVQHNTSVSFSVNDLPGGIYFLRVHFTNGTINTDKIIIQ